MSLGEGKIEFHLEDRMSVLTAEDRREGKSPVGEGELLLVAGAGVDAEGHGDVPGEHGLVPLGHQTELGQGVGPALPPLHHAGPRQSKGKRPGGREGPPLWARQHHRHRFTDSLIHRYTDSLIH